MASVLANNPEIGQNEKLTRSLVLPGKSDGTTSGSIHVSLKSEDEKPAAKSLELNSKSNSLTNSINNKDIEKNEKKVIQQQNTQSTDKAVERHRKSKSRTSHPKKQLKRVVSSTWQTGDLLEDELFYHGYMAREECEKIIQNNGEFLVRKTEAKGQECFVISIRWNDGMRHLRIQQTKHQKNWWIHEFCFQSIPNLIKYHHETGTEVHVSGIKLGNYIQREEWQLYHEQVTLGKKLGAGEFGEVLAGTLTVGLFTHPIPVAVKTLKGKLTGDDRVTFLREANVMLKLNHKYIIRLYGVATQREPIMIVMECAAGGSLVERVRRNDKASLEAKRRYCKQIVSGMKYLEVQQVIHRDLAARNVLLNKSDKCKISDFGLSLLGKLHKEKKAIKVPVRWLAPETLTKACYSSKTDVWSYGVLIFEVFSDGTIPYSECKNLREVRQRVARENLRLASPMGMPSADAQIMRLCFETNPDQRYSFTQLKQTYKTLAPDGLLPKLANLF